MKKRNVPLILRGSGFGLLGFVIFCLIQGLYLPLGEVLRWRNFYAEPENSVDVVFVGTSHTYHSFNPEVIDAIVPIHSHSVGIPGDSIQIVYHELKSILREQEPKAIFVDAFSLSISHWLDGPYVYRFLNASFRPANVISSAQILFSNGYDWWNYFPMVRYTKERNDFVQLFKNPTDATPPEYAENPQGFAALTDIISDEAYANIPMEGFVSPLPDAYMTYLEKVIDLSREAGFQLGFTDSPWMGFENPVYDLYERDAEMAVLEAESLPYYDFRSAPLAYDWRQIHLYDRDHPSEFGAVIISVRMAEQISELLEIPLDEEQLAWYQNFYFDDFTLEETDGETTITLIPANADAPLRYDWQVMEADKITPASSTARGTSPQFWSETPAAGTYWITVTVTQEGGDFALHGNFPYTVAEN